MTKIDQIQPGQSGEIQKKQPGRTAAPGESFGNVLERVQSAQEASSSPTGVTPVDLTQTVSATTGVGEVGAVSQLHAQGVEAAESALRMLEDYGQAMTNGSVSLKDMAPLVQALETQTAQLGKIIEGLEPGDELRGILEQVASAATVETVKFNRGDFLPAS